MNISRQQKQAFYQSRQWKQMSKLHLAVFPYCQCQQCADNGLELIADETHHVIDVDVDWSKRLEWSNLLSVNHDCHSRITMTATNRLKNQMKQSTKYDDVTNRLLGIATNCVSGGTGK